MTLGPTTVAERLGLSYQSCLCEQHDTATRKQFCGWKLVDDLLELLEPQIPVGLTLVRGPAYINGLPPRSEWDAAIVRGAKPGRTRDRVELVPREVIGLFEVKGYGMFGFTAGGLRGEAAVVRGFERQRDKFTAAQSTCMNIRVMCYFSLQERTPKRVGHIDFYRLTKEILGPTILTLVPFHSEIRCNKPLPPIYPGFKQEWQALLGRLLALV